MKIARKLLVAICLACTLGLLGFCVPCPHLTQAATQTERYIVLMVDTSGVATIEHNGEEIYTADSALEYVQDAAATFVEKMSSVNGKNHIALVSFDNGSDLITDFTTDYDALIDDIYDLKEYGDVRDITSGLETAEELIEDLETDVIKDVVLCTTGMTNDGDYDYDGHYD